MAYEVNIGGCALYGVSSVEESATRGVAEHDAIDAGAFAMMQNEKLKTWSIRLELTQHNQRQPGWRAADKVLKELRRQLARQSSVRMVIISDGQRLSQTVLLRDVKHDTNYQGVYSVSLSLIEYVGPQVTTIAMPSIPRPGVPPKLPDTFKVNDAFGNAQREESAEPENPETGGDKTYADKDGKPVNLAGLQDDDIVRVIKEDVNSAFVTEQQKEHAAITGELETAYDNYEMLLGSE